MIAGGERLSRSVALLGEAAVARLRSARVLVVGIGGVGSWCAEALVRTGVGHVTLVDDDIVAASNVNRQCPATMRGLGRPKVEVMAERLREIAPDAEIVPLRRRWSEGEPSRPDPAAFDAVVDAIDSVTDKAALILAATSAGVPLASSMGAALRTDPTRVRVTRFDRVEGDGLARALRRRFRRLGRHPGAFAAVWSTEPAVVSEDRGSIMPVTATFGMVLAGEIISRLGTDEGG